MPSETNSNEIDLRAFLVPLKGKKKFMWSFTIGGAIAVLAYTIIIPAQWKADVTILTVLPSDLNGSAGTSLAAALSPSAPDPLQVLEGVITSRRSFDLIISRTHVGRRDLENGFKVDRQNKKALITLSWEDTDKKRALAIVKGGVDGATMLQHEIEFSSAALQAKYLEDSVHEQDQKLRDAEQTLADFEKHMKAPLNPTDPTSVGAYLKEKKDLEMELGQVNAQLKLAASQANLLPTNPNLPSLVPTTEFYRDKLIQLEYELQVAETSFGPAAPKVVSLKRNIEVAKKTLNDEIARYLQSVAINLDPQTAKLQAQKLTISYQLDIVKDLASKAPDEAVQLARLAREVVIVGNVSSSLRAKWEEAKVAAQVDQVKWAVLEPPYIEDKPTNKRYARNPFMGALGGFFVGAAILNIRSRRSAKKASLTGPDGTAT